MKDRMLTMLKKLGSSIRWMFGKIPFAGMKKGLSEKGNRKWVLVAVGLIFLMVFSFSWYISREPAHLDVRQITNRMVGERKVTGTVTTATLITTVQTLLDKPGGYLSNDIAPPMLLLDNMPNWEYGVVVQVRDLARSMRNDMSRSRSQSVENPHLTRAEPLLQYANDSWAIPSTEGEYRKGVAALQKYLDGLSQQNNTDTQFYARADNLRDWLAVVEKRLGSYSQRLGASVGQARSNTDLAGDNSASQSTNTSQIVNVKTPWMKLDDVFYEARGGTWALLNFLRAIEIDFEPVFADKNAKALVSQIIRELEGTQRSMWSPVILNGNGFGIFANHSLVMASYISRANAAVIDLRELLSQG